MSMTASSPTPANGEQMIKQRLNQLIDKFLADAKEIDPTIDGVYIGYDGPVFDRPFMVSLVINLERDDGWKVSENQMLTPTLTAAMDAYARAEIEFQESVRLGLDEETIDALWNAKEAAEEEVIRHPCQTLEDVHAKARLIIDNENVFDGVSNCTINKEHALYVFLRSLLGAQ